jgi:hypothetical protein
MLKPDQPNFVAAVQGIPFKIVDGPEGWQIIRWASGHELQFMGSCVFVWPDPEATN